eukprot:CAMPEP_0206177986 /NCGR_PEP_ID=MMETSP1474-20131121/62879_1 /ASSEMBLY_ACC=CAM_ASM_001110 /TAXON_ID=97495 /ORGANISM="Imantonia sp., Strain RCC918" /LENGTH=55 /DNA_ID=CAMNT_0053590145 /DNA_START=457 /DNA_END=624 /DNA_ORIENTATION=-
MVILIMVNGLVIYLMAMVNLFIVLEKDIMVDGLKVKDLVMEIMILVMVIVMKVNG